MDNSDNLPKCGKFLPEYWSIFQRWGCDRIPCIHVPYAYVQSFTDRGSFPVARSVFECLDLKVLLTLLVILAKIILQDLCRAGIG